MDSAKRLSSFLMLFIIFCLNVLSVNADVDKPSKAEEELYQKCKSTYTEKNYTEAGKNIKEFISSYPKSTYTPEILFMQAFIHEDINIAIGMYKDIINKYPNSTWSAKSHFQLGQCYYLQGKYNDAGENYRAIVVRYMDDPLYWQARYWQNKSLMAKGDYEGAIYSLNTMLGNKNNDFGDDAVLISLSECYIAKKDYAKAEEMLRTLIKDFPESKWLPSANFSLANCLHYSGKTAEAKEFYQKIIQNYPKSIEAKKARESLDFPKIIKPDEAKMERKETSPQLESPFLKATFDDKKTVQSIPQKKDEQKPPFTVEWKKDEENKPIESKKEEIKPSIKTPYFSVQVGAFSVKSSADNLADQLKKKGYSVEIATSSSNGKTMYKVRVGNCKTESEAREMSQKIRKEANINSTIIVPIN
jgi:TolA-binding protein